MRYLALLDDLAQWASAPPLTDAAAEPAVSLTGLVERAGHAVGEQLRRVIRSDGDGDEVDRFREATERARDAADLAAPQLGKKKAKARIKRYAELEELIAQYQIALATAEFLKRLGCVPELQRGDQGFTYGLLFSVEELIARDTRMRILQLRLWIAFFADSRLGFTPDDPSAFITTSVQLPLVTGHATVGVPVPYARRPARLLIRDTCRRTPGRCTSMRWRPFMPHPHPNGSEQCARPTMLEPRAGDVDAVAVAPTTTTVIGPAVQLRDVAGVAGCRATTAVMASSTVSSEVRRAAVHCARGAVTAPTES